MGIDAARGRGAFGQHLRRPYRVCFRRRFFAVPFGAFVFAAIFFRRQRANRRLLGRARGGWRLRGVGGIPNPDATRLDYARRGLRGGVVGAATFDADAVFAGVVRGRRVRSMGGFIARILAFVFSSRSYFDSLSTRIRHALRGDDRSDGYRAVAACRHYEKLPDPMMMEAFTIVSRRKH